jgi:hypothetical protein
MKDIKKPFKYNFKLCFKTSEDLLKFSNLFIKNEKEIDKNNIKVKNKSNFLLYTKLLKSKKKEKEISSFFSITETFKVNSFYNTNYKSEEIKNYFELKIYLPEESREFFAKLTKNTIHPTTKWCYFPKAERIKKLNFLWKSDVIIPPRYPIYIISKGRWESRLTSKTLEKLNVNYHIVIEPQEYKQYSKVIDKKKIKVLPFSNLGQGTPPARNWVWNDAKERGFDKHWILDDNIKHFYKRQNGYKNILDDNGSFFSIIENFADNYENLAQTGLEYQYFCADKERYPPLRLNTRIYSCILMNHSLLDKYNLQWRGKFQCDTDLSIRILKLNLCTVLFYEYLCGKITTMVMKGGNTQEYYAKTNKRYEFAKLLADTHPDVAKIIWKYNRWHHSVNYIPFKKNKLKKSKTYKEIDYLKYNYKLHDILKEK